MAGKERCRERSFLDNRRKEHLSKADCKERVGVGWEKSGSAVEGGRGTKSPDS